MSKGEELFTGVVPIWLNWMVMLTATNSLFVVKVKVMQPTVN